MDSRAKGCSERSVFYADAGRVCSLCAGALHTSISTRGLAFRLWADVETHARNAAVRAIASGLLAARQTWRSEIRSRKSIAKIDYRKNSVVCSVCAFVCRDVVDAKARY